MKINRAYEVLKGIELEFHCSSVSSVKTVTINKLQNQVAQTTTLLNTNISTCIASLIINMQLTSVCVFIKQSCLPMFDHKHEEIDNK